MQAEDRPIHFSTELIYAPFELKLPALQRLYYDLSQDPKAAYDNAELTPPGPPRFHSKRGEKAQSFALFLPDRLVAVEEWVDQPFARFLDRVRGIGAGFVNAFEIEGFVSQTATVRTTFGMTHFDDARQFLLDHVCNQTDRIWRHFQRPIGVGGIRFVLPGSAEHPGTLHVIIESYRYSRDEVFVEVKGLFGRPEVAERPTEDLIANIEGVRRFINEAVYPYLQQFDVIQENPT